ncbi:hypothetical protein J4Q44_G00064280 [Coregonus suidteri]|uniref:Tektin n=1 Tax=Coregonus suidteri TaxID=861788 RepID=A0AAN8M6U7_9TELE
MWRSTGMKSRFLKPGPRYTQPDWSFNNNLVTKKSELQRALAYQINQDLHCARGDATTQIRWATWSTKDHLTNRVEELGHWQSQSADSIGRVDQEMAALVKVKAIAERCLQEKVLYRQVLRECVALRDGRTAAELVHDDVEAELKREVELAEEIIHLIQQKIHLVLDNLWSLKDVRTQLMADHRDKGEAVKLNKHCLTFDLQSPNLGYKYQPCHIVKGTLTYDQWVAYCKRLKQTAEKLVLDCSYFRGNLQYTLSKLMNALETQRCASDFCLRKRLNELSRARDALEWEKQQLKETVVDLVKEMQKVERQIMNSGSEQQLAHTRLDILAQRANYELCMDQPHIALLKENKNLRKNTFGLQNKLLLSQKTLESMHMTLFTLGYKLEAKSRALDIDRRCQEVRQSLLPLRGSTVVTANTSAQEPLALLSPLSSPSSFRN